jgi:SAM-dependent methyltransferase
MQIEEKDRELFDRIVSAYARKDVAPVCALPRKKLLLAAFRPLLQESPRLGRLLEVGCGVGAAARYLDGRYETYLGIDHSPKMIEAARIFNRGNKWAEFLTADIKTVDLTGSSVDTILANGALHHIPDLDAVMENLVRLAGPGCRILAIEPQNGNPLIQFMRFIRKKVDKAYSRDQVFFSEHELTALFARHGVSGISVRYLGYFSPPFAQVIFRPQFIFLPLGRLSSRLDSWLSGHLPGIFRKLSFNIVISGVFLKLPPQKTI